MMMKLLSYGVFAQTLAESPLAVRTFLWGLGVFMRRELKIVARLMGPLVRAG
jgi:hypothetical protein